jgi:hypothetical protein
MSYGRGVHISKEFANASFEVLCMYEVECEKTLKKGESEKVLSHEENQTNE